MWGFQKLCNNYCVFTCLLLIVLRKHCLLMRRTKQNRWRDFSLLFSARHFNSLLYCERSWVWTDVLVMKVLPLFWCQLFLANILQSFTFEKHVLCLESPKNRKKNVQPFSLFPAPIPILSQLSQCCLWNKGLKSNSQCSRINRSGMGV